MIAWLLAWLLWLDTAAQTVLWAWEDCDHGL